MAVEKFGEVNVQDVSKMTAEEQKKQQAESVTLSAKGMATRFTREIGAATNKKWTSGAQMSCLVTSLIFENFVIFAISRLFPVGSKEGDDLIFATYQGALRDARDRWGYKKVDET